MLSRSALWLYKGTFDDIDYEAFFRGEFSPEISRTLNFVFVLDFSHSLQVTRFDKFVVSRSSSPHVATDGEAEERRRGRAFYDQTTS